MHLIHNIYICNYLDEYFFCYSEIVCLFHSIWYCHVFLEFCRSLFFSVFIWNLFWCLNFDSNTFFSFEYFSFSFTLREKLLCYCFLNYFLLYRCTYSRYIPISLFYFRIFQLYDIVVISYLAFCFCCFDVNLMSLSFLIVSPRAYVMVSTWQLGSGALVQQSPLVIAYVSSLCVLAILA